jgi:hypothetical protein
MQHEVVNHRKQHWMTDSKTEDLKRIAENVRERERERER